MQQEELKDLKKLFLTLDTNKDGTLSKDELKNGLQNVTMFELFQNHNDGSEDCYQQIINTCDMDGDGKLDYNEFIQAAINHKALLNEENIQIIFKMISLSRLRPWSYNHLVR